MLCDVETMISQFYVWRNVAFSTEDDEDLFEFDAETDELENSTKERQGDYFRNSWQWKRVNVGRNVLTLAPRQAAGSN